MPLWRLSRKAVTSELHRDLYLAGVPLVSQLRKLSPGEPACGLIRSSVLLSALGTPPHYAVAPQLVSPSEDPRDDFQSCRRSAHVRADWPSRAFWRLH